MPQYLSINEAAQRLPGRPHRNSVRRWMLRGCYGEKLRSVRFGAKRLTTDQWISEFVEAVQALDPACTSAHQEASAKLDALGV
jgi:hypothetical protein